MEYTAKTVSKAAIDTLLRRYCAAQLPPEGHFHYHQGVFLSGVEKMAHILNDESYYTYIKEWVDAMVASDGEFYCFNPGALDDLQPGILLFDILNRTGEEKYKRLLDKIIDVLSVYPENEEGGYFHMAGFPHQMWLDGLYMAGPLAVEYGVKYNREDLIKKAFKQMKLMYKHCKKEENGLLYHGWDCLKQAPWADKDGVSHEVWGRAAGWFAIGGLDMIELLPEGHEEKEEAKQILKDYLAAVLKYQDEETGLWYQVVDKGEKEGNWLEASCSMLFTCAVLKAIRLGILPEINLDNAKKGFCGLKRFINIDENGKFLLSGICVGTGIGDFDYYINRETSENDLHGMGAFLLMCAEMAKLEN